MALVDTKTNTFCLNDLGYFYGGLTGKSGSDFGKGTGEYITFVNVINNIKAIPSLVDQVVIKPGENQNQVQKDDLLFNGSSETPEEVAFPSVVPYELDGAFLNSFCFGFRFKDKNKLDPLFFAYYLESALGRQIISQLAQGSTRYNISKTALAKIDWNLPKLAEQKAIAEALSDIDELISMSRIELTKRSNIASGIISQLIDGSYFRSRSITWNFRTIKDLGINVEKGSLITEKTARPGKIPVIAGGFKPAYYHDESNRSGTTITVSASGANAGFVNIWREEIWASDCSTISESTEYDVRYIYYVLLGLQSEIYKSQYGGAQPHVRPNEIYNLVIPWINFDEQQFVAEILDDAFFEIKVMEDQIRKYEWLKQGMMNDLLTGKVRLV